MAAKTGAGTSEPFHPRQIGDKPTSSQLKWAGMPTNMDEAKGRAKRAAGELTDDDKLKREGTVDKAAGKAKESVEEAATKAKELMENDS
jgi:uncharacterized protein YjbJ (UPF0337 family)